MNEQRGLDFTPDPPAERVMLIRPTPEAIRKAKKPLTVRVLRMLQEGPKTTHDFWAAFIGSHKQRIYELRQAGHVIERKDLGDSSALFTLVSSPSVPTGEPNTD